MEIEGLHIVAGVDDGMVAINIGSGPLEKTVRIDPETAIEAANSLRLAAESAQIGQEDNGD